MFSVHKEEILVQLLVANKLQLKLLMIQGNWVIQGVNLKLHRGDQIQAV